MKHRLYMWLSILVLILLWALLALAADNSIKAPSPLETLQALIRIMTDERFLVQVIATIRRSMVGFVIAFAMGITFGIAAGVSRSIFYLLQPIVLIQRTVPTMGVILLALIWLGREIAPILVCILVIFPIIYSAVVNAIREVDQHLLEMTRVYKFGRLRTLRHLYLPSVRSALLAVAAAAISLNLKLTIAAEVLGQPGLGIGTGFQMEKVSLNTDGVLAWAFVAIVIGAVLEFLVSPGFLGMLNPRIKHK